MPDVPMPLGEWRPDIALLDNQFAAIAENVFMDANSYTPVPNLAAITTVPLPDACGLFAARTSNGEWRVYGGTPTALYRFDGTTWIDVSRTTGGAYHVASGDLWSFAQFGDLLFAVNENDDPQQISITAGANFIAVPGSPPMAGHVKQIGDFLFLSRLVTGKNRIIWCGINDTTMWMPGTNLCDEQEFPQGGLVQGVAGGQIGYVVQDHGVHVMQFLPGDTTYIFSFSRVAHERGSISKYGFVANADTLFCISDDGFYAIAGANPSPIGDNKVNEWWLANTDPLRRNLTQVFASMDAHRILWAFYSSGTSQTYDKVIIFDWALQRWSYANLAAKVWAMLASVSLDLDTTGTDPGDDLADSTAPSLDSLTYLGGLPFVGAIDVNDRLAFMSGPNLPATVETGEAHLVPSMRAFVNNAYPLVDCLSGVVSVSAGTRERLQDARDWSDPFATEITGSVAIFTSARLHRFRVMISDAAVWTHAQGVLVDAQQDGTVA